MENSTFTRKQKEEKPVLAICYDFDKTLSPDDMQAQGYIQSVGFDLTDVFWKKTNESAKDNEMDQNLAYMFWMKQEAEGKLVFNRNTLREYGSKVAFFPGVETWFSRIREYGKEKGVIVEHYIISSGLKEMIEGTSVAHEFEKIFASSFLYNDKGVAVWPAQVVNYTNKTQFLFRIEKGILDINDSGVNDYCPPEDIRIPFANIVYIGDSDTDIPCMKLVNSRGGYSIGIFNHITNDKTKVYKMMREKRIEYFVPSDYSEKSELDTLIKAIIDKTAAVEKLGKIHEVNHRDNVEADKLQSVEERLKTDLIIELESSYSFLSTHNTIRKMSKYSDWSDKHIEQMCKIALNNSQVRLILDDDDVSLFYRRALHEFISDSEDVKHVKKELGLLVN